MPRTIIEKLWDAHLVHHEPGRPMLLFIDLHLVHEVTSPQAFQGLRERGLKVRRPDLTIATADHSIPTTDRSLPIVDEIAARQLAQRLHFLGLPQFLLNPLPRSDICQRALVIEHSPGFIPLHPGILQNGYDSAIAPPQLVLDVL